MKLYKLAKVKNTPGKQYPEKALGGPINASAFYCITHGFDPL
jgi:hypothetical protein